jgi:hypothetical protein
VKRRESSVLRRLISRRLPRFTFCFACTLVATALAFALLSSQGVLGA